METLNELAVKAFEKGSDNFGEKVVGFGEDGLHYSTTTKSYHITLLLEEPNGHPCTSGIGLYVNPSETQISFVSGHKVFDVDMTPEYKEQLDEAKKIKSVLF